VQEYRCSGFCNQEPTWSKGGIGAALMRHLLLLGKQWGTKPAAIRKEKLRKMPGRMLGRKALAKDSFRAKDNEQRTSSQDNAKPNCMAF